MFQCDIQRIESSIWHSLDVVFYNSNNLSKNLFIKFLENTQKTKFFSSNLWNNTQNNLNPRPETGFNFPVYFKNIDPVKQLFFLQSCNYTCIILLSFPRKNNRNPITSTLLMLYFPYT